MTLKRMAATGVGAFIVSQALAILVHGFLLARDYAPFYGNLLRSPTRVAWQALFLPVSHLCFISALLWVYVNVRMEGSRTIQGLKLGLLGWIVAQAPLYLIWYAEQPLARHSRRQTAWIRTPVVPDHRDNDQRDRSSLLCAGDEVFGRSIFGVETWATEALGASKESSRPQSSVRSKGQTA